MGDTSSNDCFSIVMVSFQGMYFLLPWFERKQPPQPPLNMCSVATIFFRMLRSFTKRSISVGFNENAVFSLKDSTGKWKDMVEFKLRYGLGFSKQVYFDILEMLGHDL